MADDVERCGQARLAQCGLAGGGDGGALDLRLGGMRSYGGVAQEGAYFGEGTENATPMHLLRALRLYKIACGTLWGGVALAALATAIYR